MGREKSVISTESSRDEVKCWERAFGSLHIACKKKWAVLGRKSLNWDAPVVDHGEPLKRC